MRRSGPTQAHRSISVNPARANKAAPQHLSYPFNGEDRRPPVTIKTVLIAVAAVVALIGAALIAVPSAHDGVPLCLDVAGCAEE